MRRARAALLLLLSLASAAVIVVFIARPSTPHSALIVAQPTAAPPLPLDVIVPPSVTLGALRGKPVVINFWASWCDPCREEAPGMERLAMTLQGRVTLVGVDWDDTLDGGRQFIAKYHWTFPVLRDADGVAGEGYGVRGLPATFIVDQGGRIVNTLFGPQTPADIQAALDQQGLLVRFVPNLTLRLSRQ
jgi:cytochrome c biogenesis protein CcmG/thiol:disulfide interchange protein DsbE